MARKKTVLLTVPRDDTPAGNEPLIHHYEINVAKLVPDPLRRGSRTYVHFFATSERSCVGAEETRKVAQAIIEAFPSPEYEVSVRGVVEYTVAIGVKEVS